MSLGLGLGIDKSGKSAWLPSDESTLEAWYKNGTGITVDVGVSQWVDSSKNSYTMGQSTDAEQPAYSAGGTLHFDESASQSLVSSTAIGGVRGLEEEFVIGFKIDPDEHNTVVLGHTSTQSEMIKLLNASTIRIKPSTSNVDFTMESGHDVKDDSSWIIVRKNNDEVSVYKDMDGILVQQDDTKACAGDFVLDTIGRRAGETPNYFDGTIKEIVIFKDVADADSDALRDNLYARLKNL